MAEARDGSGERRPSKAEIRIPGYRLGGCGRGGRRSSLPAEIRGHLSAVARPGRVTGMQVRQARSYPERAGAH